MSTKSLDALSHAVTPEQTSPLNGQNITTAGGVVFVAGSNLVTEEASNLFWNSSSDLLGIWSESNSVQPSVAINPQAPLHVFKAVGNGTDRPTPSDVSFDTVAIFERDEYPNPAGVSINLIAGEDCQIKYGSTSGDLNQNTANLSVFDYDIRANAFRFVPLLSATENRPPGMLYQHEAFTIYPNAVSVDALGTAATSTGTQTNSLDFRLEGSFYNGSSAIRSAMVLRTIASTTQQNAARLAFVFASSIGTGESDTERASITSSGFFQVGNVAAGQNTIILDPVTNGNVPLIRVTGGELGIATSSSGIRIGIANNGYVGIGGLFDLVKTDPLAPLHVLDSLATPLRVERNGGSPATTGFLTFLFSQIDDPNAAVILNAGTGNDIAIRSNNGSSTTLRITSDSRGALYNGNFTFIPTSILGWNSSSSLATLSVDAAVARNAAGVLEIDNGTPGQYRDLILRNLTQTGTQVTTPSAAQTLTPTSMISAASAVAQITSGSPVTLTSAPTIANGVDGQRLTIINVGSNAITLQDQGTLANSNLRLTNPTVTIGPRQSIQVMYSATIGDWVQVENLVPVM